LPIIKKNRSLTWKCLLFNQRNTMHKILGTSAVYRVAWFVENGTGVYWTVIKLQKNESGNCSIWKKFYIEDVYWNTFDKHKQFH
jgi:hypothetical protein